TGPRDLDGDEARRDFRPGHHHEPTGALDHPAHEPADAGAVGRWALPAPAPRDSPARGKGLRITEGAPDLEPGSTGEEEAPADPPVRVTTEQAAAHLRDVAVPTLRIAVSRLLARGHQVSIHDALDTAEPRLTVLFRPSEGPLRPVGAPEPGLAGFEIRIDRLGTEAPGGSAMPQGPIVIAARSSESGLLTLGRTPAEALTAEWAGARFVDFVQSVLSL